MDHGSRGLTLEPSDAEAHLVQALALFQSGHPFRARAHLREALRIEPSPHIEETFRGVDLMCRPPGLPLYGWSFIMERIPGQAITIWVVFIVALQLGRVLGLPPVLLASIGIGYLTLAIYTWIAHPIARLWVRVFPAR